MEPKSVESAAASAASPRGSAAAAATGGSDDALQPDPTALPQGPSARPGAPLSEAIRQTAAELVAGGSDWMEGHWREARWAGLAVAAGSLLFMLRWGHIPGWMRYTSLAELPTRLLAPEARRLPVALHSVAQHGEALSVRVAHYPLLRRLLDAYRGVPITAATLRAAREGELLTVHLAGPIQPTDAGLRRLQSLPRGAVHRLRLLSIVGAGEQSWTTAGPARPTASPAAAAQLAPLPADGTPAAGVKPLEASNSRSSSWWRDGFAGDSLPAAVADGVPAEPPTAEAAAGAPAGQLAVSPGSHLAQREQQAAGGTGDGASQLLLWGELYCRERPRGLAALLPRRRADMGERLVAQGEAALMEPIDLEWLGVGWVRIDRLYAAEQAAIAGGLGMWAVRRPTLREWSRSLARSAWVRVRHAARTSATATAGSLGSAAAAAGGTLTQAARAGADGATRAARAAGAAASQAVAASAGSLSKATGLLTGRPRGSEHVGDVSGQPPSAAGQPPRPPADAGGAPGGPSVAAGTWGSRAGAALSRALPRWPRS